MTIGNTTVPHGLMLAPMAGITDRTMRLICSENGAEYAVTEMVSAKALVYEQLSRPSAPVRTADLCVISGGEAPASVQIFGSEPEFLAEAAKLISTCSYRGFRGVKPAAVDINMGCPVKKVAGNGEGSALMKDPEKIFRIVEAVSAASALPVTVKIRAGWDSDSINAAQCASAAEKGGAAAVCVHARTRTQFYRPGIMTEVIGQVKAAVGIPVFGNGDITAPGDAVSMMRSTGCDGVAVARGAVGNPFIFRRIAAAIDGRDDIPPSDEEILRTALRQLDLTVADKGEHRGLCEVRFSLAAYLSGRRGASSARDRLMTSDSYTEVRALLTDFFGGSTAANH